MRLVLLHLSLACLALSLLSSVADGVPLQVLSAPNLLRIGSAENIFVECQECTGGPVNVQITVMNHPTKIKMLGDAVTVTLSSETNFQGFGQIMIPAGDFQKDPNLKQYVYLQAQFPGRLLEKVVLVSFQSGYIFIQTDKTIYTPESKVHYRMFAVTPDMKPIERNHQGQGSSIINIEIVTPEGIILPEDPVSLKSGIYSGVYQLPEIVSPGVWKVVSKFNSNPQHSYSADFEVKEYVLPSFEVKIKIPNGRNFFHVDDEELRVEIEAMYLFGKEVDGTAYVVFGVIQNDRKRGFKESIQRVEITNGKGMAILRREHITQTFGDIGQLVKTSIYVSVTVRTASGSEMVEAEKRGIQIVRSPYTIHFKKTPKYFKPTMSFEVVVYVVNPDDTPADGIQVVVNPGKVEGVTSENGIARIPINPRQDIQHLDITAETNVPGIRQASASMRALPYATTTNNYLHISVDASEIKLNDNLKITIQLNGQQNVNRHLTYLIQSRGQLVKHVHHETNGAISIVKLQQITKEMLPSFRIIAYYHIGVNEVVSDSAWVDVVHTCMGSLKLESTRDSNSYEPRNIFGLKITGDPGAIVGLVAVDKGVYVLNNKNRLTMTKVWDLVEKYDTGCTPGGGKNSMGVFYDAGLLFETNTVSGTPYRQELNCPVSARRKRATTIMDVTTSLLSQYTDKLQRQCCLDGMKDLPLSYNCDRRSEYIMDGDACVKAFLKCCKTLAEQEKDNQPELILARSEEDSFTDSNDIVSRTKFPESWLWNDVILPNCADGTTNCKTTSVEKKIALQDSITTWQLTGISLSRTHGICIDDTFKIIVQKDFFIDLRLPYSAVRGEQLEIKAILHNYRLNEITVRVHLLEEANVCSSATKRGKFTQTVKVGPMTTRSVPFVIIPMKDGNFPIEVKAAVKDSSLDDGVRKILLVVPRGILQKIALNRPLDPVKHNGVQVEIINSQIPEIDIVPNTPRSTHIAVTGGRQMSVLVENALSGTSMGSLIYQPSGCGEQNMIHMTLPVIATTYLDKTNQWENVGLAKRDEALTHIKTGYKNEVAFRKPGGGFAVWKDHNPSSWLTAYVVKVLSMAYNLVDIDESVLCDATKWLALNTQQPDGIFKEVGKVYHGEMMGDMRGLDSEASMTAFTLIAMQEAQDLCAEKVNNLPRNMEKAVDYLEMRLPSLTNPYAVAMVSYALANADRFNQEILYKFASREFTHWPVPRGNMYTLEATAYALLALVKVKAFEEASPIVKWFNTQRFVGGGYGSTQATIMVYQAVSEYWVKAKEQQYEMEVKIDLPGRAKPDRFSFNSNEHSYATRSSKLKDINQDMKVTATGSGEATVTVVSLFYAVPKEPLSDCQKFNMSVELQPVKLAEGENVYMLRIEVLYMDKDKDAGMTILDIGLFTGYTVDTDDLDLLSQGRDKTISKYEMNTILSERGSLIIYLDKVSHRRPDEVAFKVRQTMKVAVLQPAAVSVYEYYDQKKCVKFYHPARQHGQLLKLCQNDECTCAEEDCSMQKTGQIDNNERVNKACETEAKNKIDYVYKVKMKLFEDKGSTDIYSMQIESVIKEGTYDLGIQGQLRVFLGYSHCREALNLKNDKTYLIMGTSQDTYKAGENKGYQYVLGERTWVEYWPTAEECQKSDEFRATCIGMEELVDTYTIFGCPD